MGELITAPLISYSVLLRASGKAKSVEAVVGKVVPADCYGIKQGYSYLSNENIAALGFVGSLVAGVSPHLTN